MSVSQLWLQLVGQILGSSIHHVHTGGLSVCDTGGGTQVNACKTKGRTHADVMIHRRDGASDEV